MEKVSFSAMRNLKTLTDKYFLLNRDNLTQPILIVLSQKPKIFSGFSASFLKFSLTFQHFPKKDEPDSRCLSEITDSEKGDWINV